MWSPLPSLEGSMAEMTEVVRRRLQLFNNP